MFDDSGVAARRGRANGSGPILRQTKFVTFDGSLSQVTAHQRPDRYRQLEVDFGRRKRIARGAGLSYVAASFGSDVVVQQMTAFDRLLGFDPAGRTIRVEAGCSLAKLVAWAQEQGLCVPVLPGYPLITVGGCVAADVHGKNPFRDGTFCDWVDRMTLFHPSRGYRVIDRSNDAVLFEATCGGFGMTGLIVDVTLRLVPLPARNVRVERVPVDSLSDAVDRLRAADDRDFAYSWHDGTLRGSRFGRGILYFGAWTDEGDPPADATFRPMTASGRSTLPFPLWNRLTARTANELFRRLAAFRTTQVCSPFEAAFPFAHQTLYHRFYGRRGFREVQILVPDQGVQDFISGLSALVSCIDPPIVMMSLKKFSGRQKSLSLSGTGMLFALDLCHSERTLTFLSELDALMLSVGAQPNVSKDSRLPGEVASRALPSYAEFFRRVSLSDSDALYASDLSRRLLS